MPSYSVKQIAYADSADCVEPIAVTVENIQGSAQEGDNFRIAPYQQIVIHPEGDVTFDMNKTYYLSLTIPKNQNYDLQYGIRLIKYQEQGDLDSMNYQFIRYITSRRVSDSDNDSSRVVLFQEKDEYGEFVGDIKVAIAEEVEEPHTLGVPGPSGYLANTMYHWNNLYFWCTADGQYWPADHKGGDIYVPKGSDIGKNDALLSHSWKMSQTDLTDTYNIIFKPRIADMSAIYMHLIPTPEDNDIQWQASQDGVDVTYYGRHIDIEAMEVSVYRLKNLLDVSARRFGIWGRPGLMFHIEGEEVRIGPSGYYELHDFTVNELGVAAFEAKDRFTIDIQYG